ncbi:MAG TPA: hypothetical protein VM492_02510 [Sumerlaeia bacterium]|nr:hypothetical protein [Sumerlaeia bacterium]
MLAGSRSARAPRAIALVAAFATLIPALLAGCSRGKRADAAVGEQAPSPTKEPTLEVGSLFESLSAEELALYQPDVRLGARWHDGFLWVSIRNETDRPLRVHPANFGVSVRHKELYRVTRDRVRSQFPISVLEPNAMASGRFRFLDLGDLAGEFCFFNHPDVRPSRCTILASPPILGSRQSPQRADSKDPPQESRRQEGR